jgi:hypothetical protein
MLQVRREKVEEESGVDMENLCKDLFNEWKYSLSFEEKQIWLWNALVAMTKIKLRRNPS